MKKREKKCKSMKTCNKCKIEKPFSEFCENQKYKSRYTSYCKKCHKNYCVNYAKKTNYKYQKAYNKTPKGRFSTYRSVSKRNGTKFTLLFQEFEKIITEKCIYCGSDGKVGIDRFDSSLGYVSGNCVACCWKCNRMKANYSEEDFLEHIYKIYEHRKGNI